MTFFDLTLVESMIPDNAVACKQSLTQEQAVTIIEEGVVPCSKQAHQVLERFDANISNLTRVPDELSVGDNFLVLDVQHRFSLWTRLA